METLRRDWEAREKDEGCNQTIGQLCEGGRIHSAIGSHYYASKVIKQDNKNDAAKVVMAKDAVILAKEYVKETKKKFDHFSREEKDAKLADKKWVMNIVNTYLCSKFWQTTSSRTQCCASSVTGNWGCPISHDVVVGMVHRYLATV